MESLGGGPASRYLDPETETMSRSDIVLMQEERLLDLVPYVYERSGLIRQTWDEAGVKPSDIRSMADFQERVPFIDKEAIRRYREAHNDPFGGLCCVPRSQIRTIWSTGGTTGEPTMLPDRWTAGGTPMYVGTARDMWEFGLRPGDRAIATGMTSRGPWHQQFQLCGAVPLFFDGILGDWLEMFDVVREYDVVFVVIALPAILAWDHLSAELNLDMKQLFANFHAVVYAGEPLGPRMRRQLEGWGIQLGVMSGAGDVGAAFSCREADGLHLWEDIGFYESIEFDGTEPVADGEVGELVSTAIDNPIAPLVRYRSDDLVRVTREPCACGRTHARQYPLGRRGDQVVVDGRSVLPIDLWEAIEQVAETSDGLFQLIRTQRDMDELRVRVGYNDSMTTNVADLKDRLVQSVHAAVGIEPSLDLVPESELLAMGPAHKIPRVATA